MSIILTPEQFTDQWKSVTGSLLDKNAHNFVVAASLHMKRVFQMSFAQGGFYGGTSSAWAPRKSKWGMSKSHPLLNETGSLKNSLVTNGGRRWNTNGKYSSGKSMAEVEISTTAKGSRKKMGDNSGFAAVHNSDPNLTGYTVNQYSTKKPIQRQFIGFNKKAEDHISLAYISRILLDGIPH